MASTLTVEASEETQGLTLQCTFLCSTGECMRVQDFGLPFYSTVAILQLAEEGENGALFIYGAFVKGQGGMEGA